jgi:hypothetical protein
MLYSISYTDGPTGDIEGRPAERSTRTEMFPTEGEALTRASRLLDEGTHHGVSLCDASGNILCGVRLQLKLGFNRE